MTSHSFRRKSASALVCALLGATAATFSATAFAAPADEIKALLDRGQARQAWQLGKNSPGELGKPAFDYYYGLAAIDAGEPTDGVLALERYLLNNPGSVIARLELGRGYFLLGDTPRAREMFDEVLRLNPPTEVRERIARFQSAIRERESAYKTTATGHVELNVGHDSNINSGLDQDTITLPLFGTLTLSADGRETRASFGGVAGGFQVNHPIRPGVALFAGGSLDERVHRNASQFDQRTLSAAAGVAWTRDADTFRLSAGTGTLAVDRDRYRTVNSVTGEWSRSIDARRGFSVYSQFAQLEYAGDNRIRDAYLTGAGASWRQSLEGAWQPFLSLGINAGREENRRSRDDLGRNSVGLRAGLGFTITPKWNAAISANFQHSRYQAFDDFLGARRTDRFASLDAALGHSFSDRLSCRIEVSHFNNDSNIDLFSYKRTVVAAKLRYDFK